MEHKLTCPLCRTFETMCIECTDEATEDDDVEDYEPTGNDATDDPPTIRCTLQHHHRICA